MNIGIGYSNYRAGNLNNNRMAFKAVKPLDPSELGIPDDNTILVYNNDTSEKVAVSMKRIFGNVDEGINGVFRDSYNFLESEYKEKNKTDNESRKELQNAKKNLNELRDQWETQYKNGLQYRVFEESGDSTEERHGIAVEKREEGIRQHKYIDAKGNLLAEIFKSKDNLTKRNLLEMLTGDSPKQFDETLDKILETSAKSTMYYKHNGKNVKDVIIYETNLSKIGEIVAEQSRPGSIISGEQGWRGFMPDKNSKN